MTTLLQTPSPTHDRFPTQSYRLPNGLTIIHQQVPSATVVAVDVWVKAGTIAEPESWSGMAHFLEHMIFKGTDRLVPGEFDYLIETRGGITNAATSYDYAHYFINVATADLATILPHFADLLLHAAIPEGEFDLERDVVLEEIRQAQDDPDGLGFQLLMETIYQQHPYGRSVLGDPQQLLNRSPAEMRTFHRARYQPDKMTIVMVGNITADSALELVDRAFQQFPEPPTCPAAIVLPELPLEGIRRQSFTLPRLEQARLMMAWLAPGADQLHQAYGLDLLSVLLAGGRTARLVQELREDRQLVLDVVSSFSLQRDSSLFTITAWLDPADLDRVEAIICDRLTHLASTTIPDNELHRQQRLLCNDFAFSTETTSQLAGLYGYYSTIAQPERATSYPKVIQSLNSETLQHLASEYLSPLKYGVVTLTPA